MIAGLYGTWHGSDGIRTIATRVHRLSQILAEGLRRGGTDVVTSAFFDTITVSVPGKAESIAADACARGVNLRLIDADHLGSPWTRPRAARTSSRFGKLLPSTRGGSSSSTVR